MEYVGSKEAVARLGVCYRTVLRWVESGKLKTRKNHRGERQYLVPRRKTYKKRRQIVYARVSTKDEEDDLDDQIDFLSQKFPAYEVISDVGSGLDTERSGFRQIVSAVCNNKVETVVVVNKDRWVRFNYEFFEYLFNEFNAALVSLNRSEFKSTKEELADDLTSVVPKFGPRYRRKKT